MMQVKKIPTVYKVYQFKFKRVAVNGVIRKDNAKEILNNICRIPKENQCQVIHEMHELGLITCEGNELIKING